MEGRRYPIGIQTFAEIARDGYVYVDKTNYIYQLAHKYKYVFLSRPRRFGKSLLSSTFKSYFEGRKELFDSLAIDKLETEWTKHPVLYFDFSSVKTKGIDEISTTISNKLNSYEVQFGIDGRNLGHNDRLGNLIHTAHEKTGERVVVIIDEYDAPLLEVMHDAEILAGVRQLMRNFYSPLKSCDSHIKFVFITGITKFSQLSIFSELNNLTNISMMPEYSGMCGITKAELESQFEPEIAEMAKAHKCSPEQMLAKLRENYDGYHFSEESDDIFNPFSILNALSSKRIKNYWFETGTPSFLIRMMDKFNTTVDDVQGVSVDASDFDAPSETLTSAIPLLYQSGYITIKDYDSRLDTYTLGIPNNEVLVGLTKALLPFYTGKPSTETNSMVKNLIRNLLNNDVDAMLSMLKSFYASIPYDLENKTEKHYQTIFFTVFAMMGSIVATEVKTATGRADAVVKTDSHIYVFEMKLDGTAKNALKQINDKGYLIPYACDGRTLVKIGVNFDSSTRTIGDWVIEEGE